MSTRFYPRFVKGNPQLRIFLPDWKMVMVKPPKPMPDNIVTFKVDPRMTDWDVKNYLEKIYKVPIGAVNSQILAGPLKRTMKMLIKGDDFKLAYVTLPLGKTFKWPDLFPAGKFEEQRSDYEKTLEQLEKDRTIDPITKMPGWTSKFN